MHLLRILPLVALTTLLPGCASSPHSPDPSPPPKPALLLDGNWEFAADMSPSNTVPAPLPSPIADFTGALQSADGKVTGTLRALATPASQPCVGIFADLPTTGTLDASSQLTLNIALPGGTATVTAALPSDLRQKILGNWQIVGGPCAMPSTPIHIEQFAPVTGVYRGTYNRIDLTTGSPIPGTAISVVATLNQSTNPNADGQFPLSGSVDITGSCTGAITITGGIVVGNGVQYPNFNLPLPQPLPALFNGAIDTTATTIAGSLGRLDTCGENFYTGTLTRQ